MSTFIFNLDTTEETNDLFGGTIDMKISAFVFYVLTGKYKLLLKADFGDSFEWVWTECSKAMFEAVQEYCDNEGYEYGHLKGDEIKVYGSEGNLGGLIYNEGDTYELFDIPSSVVHGLEWRNGEIIDSNNPFRLVSEFSTTLPKKYADTLDLNACLLWNINGFYMLTNEAGQQRLVYKLNRVFSQARYDKLVAKVAKKNETQPKDFQLVIPESIEKLEQYLNAKAKENIWSYDKSKCMPFEPVLNMYTEQAKENETQAKNVMKFQTAIQAHLANASVDTNMSTEATNGQTFDCSGMKANEVSKTFVLAKLAEGKTLTGLGHLSANKQKTIANWLK